MKKPKLTRSEWLQQCLRDEIVRGDLAPGTRLDEQVLAERFQVSRTPVREALSHLASSGLVEMRRHQGATVKTLTITELVEMFQVVAELEGLCARLAARRMTPPEREQLDRAHRDCVERVEAGDPEGFFEINNRLHEIVYAGSHNAFLVAETRALRDRVNPYRHYITYPPGRMTSSNDEHAEVIAAIAANDGEAAHRLMRGHVNVLGEVSADLVASLSVMSGGDQTDIFSALARRLGGEAEDELRIGTG